MINKTMNNQNMPTKDKLVESGKKPDENNGIEISGHIKIFDPNSKEVLVKQRG